ncbi:RNA methyltransferase, partial [Lactobacillus delbrueckii subsp. lactis]|nr:RNA methyltransferase [Lactobacillus delbrueckii subsp. lactis]
TEDEYDHYLHGESLQVDSSLKGFVLVSCRGMIFSFGKLSGKGQLKNYYPKGLRQ